MRIHYPRVIQESEAELRALERQLRGHRTSDRVRLLRLLKSGQCPTLHACAPALNYSVLQLKRWWRTYRQGGLSALLTVGQAGRKRRISSAALADVESAFAAGDLHTLQDARVYLQERWETTYQSLSG